MIKRAIKCGTKIKDNITGFEGVITARCVYINGCVQYEITPSQLKDGVPQKEYWLDEQRVVVCKKAKKEAKKIDLRFRRVGGPPKAHDKHSPPSLAGYGENEDSFTGM